MSAAADCSIRWLDDNGKDHECYEDPRHGGGHQCGCGARVPRHLLDAVAAALALLHPVAAVTDLRTHSPHCHQYHTTCLAARTIATLTGEDTTDA